jgi:hypothetical protein
VREPTLARFDRQSRPLCDACLGFAEVARIMRDPVGADAFAQPSVGTMVAQLCATCLRSALAELAATEPTPGGDR